MKLIRPLFLTGSALAIILQLVACGKKASDSADQEQDGPQSTQGKILESVQKTADEANERTRKVREATDAVSE